VRYTLAIFLVSILINVLWQQLPRSKSEPPMVFHMDPFSFYVKCQQKHGDIFTFVLLGKKMTVYFGVKGNDFILNGRLQDLKAEETYRPLTGPVFGSDIIYDRPNAKLMDRRSLSSLISLRGLWSPISRWLSRRSLATSNLPHYSEATLVMSICRA
jgi:sterol 14alpha-demethylase